MSDSAELQPIAYSVQDAARVTSIGKTRLYQLIGEGRLKAHKVGKRTLILADDLRNLITNEAA